MSLAPNGPSKGRIQVRKPSLQGKEWAMSDLYRDAVTAAAESHGVTWQDAADVIDPFLDFLRKNLWNYGYGDQGAENEFLDVLVSDE